MANYQRCDRCGESTEQNNYLGIIKISLSFNDPDNRMGYGDNDLHDETFDMCKSCVRKTRDLFREKEASHATKMS